MSDREGGGPGADSWGQLMKELGILSGKLDALQTSVSEKRQDIAGALVRISVLEQRPYAEPRLLYMLIGGCVLASALIPIVLYTHGRFVQLESPGEQAAEVRK